MPSRAVDDCLDRLQPYLGVAREEIGPRGKVTEELQQHVGEHVLRDARFLQLLEVLDQCAKLELTS